ncbi:hypothetical protein BXT89_05055 [Halopseudomonas pachastrellae]|jgi:hypothetical protein|uniref:Cation transporter n=1 Tax=Halopseudomonas pachastrellae TaxID=254161 RepID=A0A1S8DJQ2_9GAMM|nr:DUF6482 family protein [Halopseudomonas pachastrellae]MED5492373.1 DUF6482 family protein [Pseudomonadota bacterium]MEE3159062.1 DUF6482 family protein [Pseudomonadota bacterium]ONM44892.1 hypothetical protein BXT89_05055 [Halopseudomonas pachastrellae]WVM89556.1 DUF6482 family protein [Halopseudomonas pachastrellae]SFM46172.1 hypothetical protein SAMN05216256_11295 [Halopseudomonas pachastrellae]
MTLEELHSAARAGQLQRLSLLSQEGSLYLVEARIDGKSALLSEEGVAKPRHFRSLDDARRTLKELAWPSIDLVHLNVADEACAGDPLSPAATQGAMRLRLPLRP